MYNPNDARLPQGDEVNPNLVRDGQQWSCQKRACYKCGDFKSNMPLTGRCPHRPKIQIMSADMAKGDTCPKFNLRPDAWRPEIPKEGNYA